MVPGPRVGELFSDLLLAFFMISLFLQVRAELEKEVGIGSRALARMDYKQSKKEGRQGASRGLPQGLQNSYGL